MTEGGRSGGCETYPGLPWYLFDRRDHELLRIVGDILDRDEYPDFKRLLTPYLHPSGIKELAAPRGIRIAYAVAHLLGSLESGSAQDRLSALRSLHDETMAVAQSSLRRNTARVLLQIMKEMVRHRFDCRRSLSLAHDFRQAVSGRPRVVRRLLRRFHLLEMPEDWNQIAFDDHVHDVNTKGRKTSTHLIMDAWIKGIRTLTVISYNHVSPAAASELLDAAAIMGLEVRLGIEFSPPFRGRFLKIIWIPRGFMDARDFLSFLDQENVQAFMEEGRKVSAFHEDHVIRMLHEFNARHRPGFNRALGVALPELDEAAFRAFVRPGQASIQHLGRYILERAMPLLKVRAAELEQGVSDLHPEEAREARALLRRLGHLDTDAIVDEYLHPEKNPELSSPEQDTQAPDLPLLMTLPARELLTRLRALHPRAHATLNLAWLKVEDVLEILFDCQGLITHLEVLNLKDRALGREMDTGRVVELQQAVNSGNVVLLKKVVAEIVERVVEAEQDGFGRRDKFLDIMINFADLGSFYRHRRLGTRLGSDSTGQSSRFFGMGLVVLDTLPPGAARELAREPENQRTPLPVAVEANPRLTFVPKPAHNPVTQWVQEKLRRFRPFRFLGLRPVEDWTIQGYHPAGKDEGNIYTLGGIGKPGALSPDQQEEEDPTRGAGAWRYLSTKASIAVRILLGFIPAFLTCALTKDWWLLAYGGAFIWFGITGIRNIIQSVLGCGGIQRSPLLRWNDYVSWRRLADSLLYTGLSVPLLDYFINTAILDRGFGVTVSTHPDILYTVNALANGVYILTHNIFRGLPRGAAMANLFRSVLSIPLAVLFSDAAGGIMEALEMEDIAGELQKWAAIISKLASDCVAGVIEGVADKYQYLRMRRQDCDGKFKHLFDAYAQVEMLYPQENVINLLETPTQFLQTVRHEKQDLVNILIVNALDLLYFWMYQPRARDVLTRRILEMSEEERQAFVLSQHVLFREREISQLFLDGLVGRNFARPLAFYLDNWQEYLTAIEAVAERPHAAQKG